MDLSERPTLSATALSVRLLLPYAAGYFLSFLYRTVNAVLAPHISRAVPLDAGDLGLMTGVYFLSFAAFQPPLGILLDRFGPRRVEAGCCYSRRPARRRSRWPRWREPSSLAGRWWGWGSLPA